MDTQKVQIAEQIDGWVQQIVQQSRSQEEADERLLAGMLPWMAPFKQLMDSCSQVEINLLVQKYEGFYRFANLLERMAQGLKDGVIQAPKAPRKKRPRKPKPKRKKRQVRRPISYLPTYTELILGQIDQTKEQQVTFDDVLDKPHVLDDETVERAVTLYEEQLTFIKLHEKQLNWWLAEKISDAQRYQIEDLKNKLPLLQQMTDKILATLAELKQGTIDRILEMDDEALGRKVMEDYLNRSEGKRDE